MKKKYNTFTEFWPFYVNEHSKPLTRKLHFIGTMSILPLFIGAIIYNSWLFTAIPIVAYGFAWVGHYFIEKNKPATFTYPMWSLIADFKMFFLICTNKMDAEIEYCNKNPIS